MGIVSLSSVLQMCWLHLATCNVCMCLQELELNPPLIFIIINQKFYNIQDAARSKYF